MMPVKSKFNSEYSATTTAILLVSIGANAWLIYSILQSHYWELKILIMLIISIVFFLITFINYLKKPRFSIGDENIIIFDFLGKTKKNIPYNTILSLTEAVNEEHSDFLLIIKTTERKIKVNKATYANYFEIRNKLSEISGLNITHEYKKNISWVKYVDKAIIVFIILCIAGYFYTKTNNSNPSNETIEFQYIQNEKPKINEEYTGESTSYNIILHAPQYPGFHFIIDGDDYNRMNRENYLNDVKVGDTLTLMVLKEDYETKLAQTKEPDFFTKHVNYFSINAIGLRNKSNHFLSIDESKKPALTNWLWAIPGGIVLCLGLLLYKNRID